MVRLFRRAEILQLGCLVPRQHSTGGNARLLGISKRGDGYLRRLFIHGARAVILHAKRDRDSLGRWIEQLERRAHRNVVALALANKLARIAWAVLNTGEPYRQVSASAF